MTIQNVELWMVSDYQEGVVGIYEKEQEAVKVYEKTKKLLRQYFHDTNNEFDGDERIILSKIVKQLYSHDTGEPVTKEDQEGNEVETGKTYWDFKEETYE